MTATSFIKVWHTWFKYTMTLITYVVFIPLFIIRSNKSDKPH